MKIILSFMAAALLASSATASDSGFSLDGSMGITSDYRFRGISQSQEDIAVQASVGLDHTSGAHVGVWGSSIKFDEIDITNASIELDYTAGFRFDVGSVNMDVGYTYYTYPNSSTDEKLDFGEVYLDAGWEGATGGVAWTDEGFLDSGKAIYAYVGYAHQFFDVVTLSAEVGNTWYDEAQFDNGQDRYMNYEVAATVTVLEKLDVTVSQVGTDLKRQDIGGLDWAEDATILTVTLHM